MSLTYFQNPCVGLHGDSGACSPVATRGWGSAPEPISGTGDRQRDWSSVENGGKTRDHFATFQRKSRPAHSEASLWQRRIFGTNQRNRLFSSIFTSKFKWNNDIRFDWFLSDSRGFGWLYFFHIGNNFKLNNFVIPSHQFPRLNWLNLSTESLTSGKIKPRVNTTSIWSGTNVSLTHWLTATTFTMVQGQTIMHWVNCTMNTVKAA